jgi:hypothetical protein
VTRVPLVRAALAVCLAVAVGGCGATSSPSPEPSASPGAAVSPSASPSASPEPSVDRPGAPDLEARLPTSVGGTPLTSVSLTGEAFMSTGGETSRAQLTAMLGELGRSTADLTVAQAADPTGVLDFQAGLLRVAGAAPELLLDEWVAAQQVATSDGFQVSNVEVGGHASTKLVDPTHADGGATNAFADGDTLVIVRAVDEALVAEVFSAI